VTSECAPLLHEALGAHILEGSLLSDNERNLGKLGGEEQASGVAKGIEHSPDVNIGKERESLNVAVLVHRVVGHLHVSLTNGLALDAAEMNGLGLRVVLDYIDYREAVDHEKVLICGVPNRTSGGRGVVEFHAHTRLLRTLAGENVGGRGLSNLSSPLEDLFAALINGLNLEDERTLAHTDVLEINGEFISWDHHTDEVNAVRRHTLGAALGSHSLDIFASRSTRPHSVRDGSREASEVGEVGVNMDRVEVAGDLGIWLIGRWSGIGRRRRRGEAVATVLEQDGLALSGTVTLEVRDHWIAERTTSLVVDSADLDELLELVADVGIAIDINGGEGILVMVNELRLDAEEELGTSEDWGCVVVPLEPFLALEHSDIGKGLNVDNIVVFLLGLESLVEVRKLAAVEEGRGYFDNGITASLHDTCNLDGLASIGVEDGRDAGFGLANITCLKRTSTGNSFELVREVNEAQEITVNGLGEDCLDDSLEVE
jgi:hypothetical protein